MERKEKQIGNYYVLSKVLGKGSYAECKKGCLVSDNKVLIAVKIVDKQKILSMDNKDKLQQEIEKLKREVNNQKQLKSENIVRLLDMS